MHVSGLQSRLSALYAHFNKFRFKLQVNREIVLQTACIFLVSWVSHAVFGKTRKQGRESWLVFISTNNKHRYNTRKKRKTIISHFRKLKGFYLISLRQLFSVNVMFFLPCQQSVEECCNQKRHKDCFLLHCKRKSQIILAQPIQRQT